MTLHYPLSIANNNYYGYLDSYPLPFHEVWTVLHGGLRLLIARHSQKNCIFSCCVGHNAFKQRIMQDDEMVLFIDITQKTSRLGLYLTNLLLIAITLINNFVPRISLFFL